MRQVAQNLLPEKKRTPATLEPLDEASYRAFFDGAVEGIFRTTPDGRYLAANPALAWLYGYDSPGHLIQELTDIAGCLYVDPRRRDDFQALLLANDKVTSFESEIKRRDGTRLWIAENARAVRDDQGVLLYYEGTVEDVTARRTAEARLRDALKHAEEANRAKSAFLATMSHELKTPLNAVIGFAQILQNESFGELGDPQYKTFANHIADSGLQLLHVISAILELSRLECGDEKVVDEVVTVGEIVDDVVPLQRDQAAGEAPMALISIDIESDLPSLRVDLRKIRQILRHLISNAQKFTPHDGRIDLGATLRDDGRVALFVADTGIGMDPDKIQMALEPFKQIDSRLARRFEGLGLGLTIARALAELHGGALEVVSALGQGTRVNLVLPAERVIRA